MAKKRTRAQKEQARSRYVYHFSELDTPTAELNPLPVAAAPHAKRREAAVELLVPTGQVVGDLGRTVMLSLIVLGLEFLIYWYWR